MASSGQLFWLNNNMSDARNVTAFFSTNCILTFFYHLNSNTLVQLLSLVLSILARIIVPRSPKKNSRNPHTSVKKVMRSSSVHSQSVALSPKNTMAQFDNGRVCSINKLASSTRSRFPGFSSNLTLEEQAHLFYIIGFL